MTKAIIIKKQGGPEVLELSDINLGKPGPDQIKVKNIAIGLNYIDTYHRSGLYPLSLPSSIGLEGAGEIIKIGSKDHEEVTNSTLILLTQGNKLSVKAISDAKFLVISGKPINEQIARGGPFVMNTKAEILQAVQDYHNGTFVK